VALAGAVGGAAPALCVAMPTAAWWAVGLNDISQRKQTIRSNFPVLGHLRYFLESIRPEIRQYFIEGEDESSPYGRQHRAMVYARSKGMRDTLPLGTQRDVYSEGYEWAAHSMSPTHLDADAALVDVGPTAEQPYTAHLLNVSAMSFGALSPNAVLALSSAAQIGGFYHCTGEGGISDYHLEGGGDLVWNLGTGYFGARNNA